MKNIKEIVKEKYTEIALKGKHENTAACCNCNGSSMQVNNIMNDSYEGVEGYDSDADLGLGCGLPTGFAMIHKGDTVIDLGSGAGNDCLVARHETGEDGKVIGIDFSEEMIERARKKVAVLGYSNVEFVLSDIESIPVESCIADVVISNCVLNLVPDKIKVFEEIYRVLKPGGHFSISDIVLVGELPSSLKEEAEMYAGCVAGAIQKSNYLKLIEKTGFAKISVQKEKPIVLPDNILSAYLKPGEKEQLIFNQTGIYSITVYAEKLSDSSCDSSCK